MATWSDLLDEIKTRGAIPTASGTFTEARFLSLANSVMKSRIVPMMDRIREGYYAYDYDSANVGPFVFDIPKRAAGAKLLNVALVNGTERLDLARYYEEELRDTTQPRAADYGFYVKRSQVYVLGTPSEWPTLRQTILLRPGTIISEDDAAQVTGIAGNVITCATVPTSWTTSLLYDAVQAEAHFDTVGIDLAISAITTGAGGSLTLVDAAAPSRLSVGDWISIAKTTPVVQVVEDVLPYLAQLVANVCLQSQGDAEARKAGREEAAELKEGLSALMSPRVQEEGKKLVNRTGLLRRGL